MEFLRPTGTRRGRDVACYGQMFYLTVSDTTVPNKIRRYPPPRPARLRRRGIEAPSASRAFRPLLAAALTAFGRQEFALLHIEAPIGFDLPLVETRTTQRLVLSTSAAGVAEADNVVGVCRAAHPLPYSGSLSRQRSMFSSRRLPWMTATMSTLASSTR